VAQKLRTRSVTAENQYCDSVSLVGHFNISISGTWVGTVTCQRSFDGGSTWFDVATWVANTEEYGFEPEREVHYRVGIKLGEFTSGTAALRLSQ
jgi:hypothetical protein